MGGPGKTANLVIHILEFLHSAHCSVCVPFFGSDHVQRQQVGIPYSTFTLVLEIVPRFIITWLLEQEGRCKRSDTMMRGIGLDSQLAGGAMAADAVEDTNFSVLSFVSFMF